MRAYRGEPIRSSMGLSTGDKLFADWSQLRSVVSVVIPTAIYVVTLPYLGIYLTSAVLIAAFMKACD